MCLGLAADVKMTRPELAAAIDTHIAQKLARRPEPAAPAASDAEFVRRATSTYRPHPRHPQRP